MKKVEAFIRHEAFEPIRAELLDKGLPSLSVLEAKGSGRQKGVVERYRGSSLTVNVRPKLKLEVVVEDKDRDAVVEAILRHARTGEVGDGKIFVLPVEEAIRIRTGEAGRGGPAGPLGGGDPRIERPGGRPGPLPKRETVCRDGGRRAHIPERGGAPLGGLGEHAQALGRGQGDPRAARSLDRRRRRPGAGRGADAGTRPLARGAAQGRPRGAALLRPRRGSAAAARRGRSRSRTSPGRPASSPNSSSASSSSSAPRSNASGCSTPATSRRCATARGSWPPASRWSPSCSWSASTCSRCGGSPTPRCGSPTSTCTSR